MNNLTRHRVWDFHARMYIEGLRQLKTVGILFLVIFSLAALFFPLSDAISILSNVTSPAEISRELVNLQTIFPFVYLPMYTMAPISILMLFNFLNKRRASDFYHALPVSRSALFISFFAAAVTLTVAVTCISAVVSIITALCFPQVFQVNFFGILKPLLGSIAGSLLVSATIALAMCITGTLLNNLLISGILLVAPRLLFSYIVGCLSETIAVFYAGDNNPFFNVSYNIPLSLFTTFFYRGRVGLPDHSSILYTAIVALLYFVIAIFLFRARKSESAGYAAATPILQTVYRLLITFLITLLPVAFILGCIHENAIDADQLLFIVIFYCMAAIAFCAYELITTKKVNRLLKIAPTFGIVLALNAVLIGGMLFTEQRILAYRPTAEEITAVSIQHLGSLQSDDYFVGKAAKIRLEDSEIKQLVSETLAGAAKSNSLPTYAKEPADDFIVTIDNGGVSRQRQLRFSQKEQEIILKALAKNSEYQAAYTLPELSNRVSVAHWALSDEQANTLYRLVYEEAQKLSFEERYRLLAEGSYPQTHYVFTSLQVSVDLDGKIYGFDVPLTGDYFPKTYNRYLAFRTENTVQNRAAIRAALQAPNLADDKMTTVSIEAYSALGERVDIYASREETNGVDFLQGLLPYLVDEVPTLNDDFCKINYADFSTGVYHEVECFFVLKTENGESTGFDYLKAAE